MALEANLTPEQVLALVPQQPPFRFIDELIKVNDQGAVGRYTFKVDESFYAGHFPDEPITPGVILLESMCQTGVVALGIYLLAKELPIDQLKQYKTLFTEAQAEFIGIVRPTDTVDITAQKVFWRRRKLRSRVEMSLHGGKVVASAVVAGIGVKHES